MKLFIVLFTLTFTLFGAHIDDFASNMGYYRDYDKAMIQAKKENKPIMLVVVGDYCPWCRKFERKTLQKAKVAINIQQNFIPVIVDKNHDQMNYPEEYYSKVVPTVYFIEPKKEEMVFESLGYVKRAEFLDTLNGVTTSYDKVKQWEK